jgi:prepilin-type processing-associated H-X9-DG protein
MTATKRLGLTRPEVLVLLALVALVAGLILPAVAKARAASNREACRNNLKQLGLATLKYTDDHNGSLPVIGGGQNSGIIVRLLPYTEENKVAEALDDSGKPWYDPANAKIIAKRLSFAQCPDAPKPDRLLEGKIGDNAFKAAPTDYTGVSLITEAIRDIFPPDHDRSTPLGGLVGRGTMSEITDGLSTTALGIVEIADKPNRWQAGKLVSVGDAMNGSGTWAANGFNAPRGYSWDGKTFPGPCAMNCSNSAAVYSFHPDGCNFVFADGSVRFLKKDIDVWVFYAVLTRRGGELLTSADF